MAPDLEKKREPRRAAGTQAALAEDAGGMLFFRGFTNNITDYYNHGSNTGVAGVSTVTGTVTRNATATNRPHSNRRINHQRHHHHRHHTQQPVDRIPLTPAPNGAIVRSSDDIGTRGATTQDICDNSNDSGLGFEERNQHLTKTTAWSGTVAEERKQTEKRRKMDIKLESEDANFSFPEGAQSENKPVRHRANGISAPISRQTNSGAINRVIGITRPRPASGLTKRPQSAHQGPVTLTSPLASHSRDGKVQLQILCQPEQQHRARYQTEGSRGAVKDRTGNSFPIVRLLGYDKPASLQVFIGTDLGRPVPHMFYQACRVSGKNSTPCNERKIDGTVVIEVDMDPTKDMVVTCDCVGILKERNVDVEHRFPHEAGVLQGRSKKKSTRCRMVFRTTITLDDGSSETLQVCSQPIVCTQPPGIPEICKKSLTSCPCTGGLELFVLGKNFLKDTRMVFQIDGEDLSGNLETPWECTVLPDKEYLQQTHLVCVVPPYRRQDLSPSETVTLKLFAVSSGKTSEPHVFVYTAASSPPEPSMGRLDSTSPLGSNSDSVLSTSPVANVSPNSMISQTTAGVTPNFLSSIQTSNQTSVQSPPEGLKGETSPPPVTVPSQVNPVMMWSTQANNCQNQEDVMMPPPNLVANTLLNRRPSTNVQLILPDNLKTEVLDENSQNSMLSENSMTGMMNQSLNGPTVPSPLDQLVNDNSRDGNPNMMRSVTTNGTPVQDALLGVVDLMRNPHPLTMVSGHQTPYGNVHESTQCHFSSQVKVLSPHHINKDTNSIIPSEVTTNGNIQGAGVVDLRMKHHQQEFNGLGAYTGSSGSLPAQSGQSIEKYLNHIESTAQSKDAEAQDANFVRASIISSNRQQQQSLSSAASAELNDLVNSAVDSHQMVSPLRTANTSPNMMVHVEHETIASPQQTRTPPIPVKTMLLEALLPNSNISSLVKSGSGAVGNAVPLVSEQNSRDDLLNTINTAMLNPIQDASTIVTSVSTNGTSTVSMQAPNKILQSSATMQQMQVMAQDAAVIQAQQVQQVEQVVAQAQQQVEQVVAQAQQQAVQVVQTAQQQVVQQVVQHAQVVQQAVQKVQAVQQVPAAPALQQAVEQESQEVVQQAVQQATHEVVQQVQAVQQAVQQAQAAQAMQQAVQQDIGSMLNQPAGFVSEASSALAIGASHEPSQQRLTNAAEHAISEVITNATQDIINNRPITTTTAHAIIATKNILNSVATQSAALMNNAMEGILPKSPVQANIVDQVNVKSPPATMPMVPGRQAVNAAMANVAQTTTNNGVVRKPEDSGGMLPQELTSMSDHDLLSYINPSCFDGQGGFLM